MPSTLSQAARRHRAAAGSSLRLDLAGRLATEVLPLLLAKYGDDLLRDLAPGHDLLQVLDGVHEAPIDRLVRVVERIPLPLPPLAVDDGVEQRGEEPPAGLIEAVPPVLGVVDLAVLCQQAAHYEAAHGQHSIPLLRHCQHLVRIVWVGSLRRHWEAAGGFRPQTPDTNETTGCQLPVLLTTCTKWGTVLLSETA